MGEVVWTWRCSYDVRIMMLVWYYELYMMALPPVHRLPIAVYCTPIRTGMASRHLEVVDLPGLMYHCYPQHLGVVHRAHDQTNRAESASSAHCYLLRESSIHNPSNHFALRSPTMLSTPTPAQTHTNTVIHAIPRTNHTSRTSDPTQSSAQ